MNNNLKQGAICDYTFQKNYFFNASAQRLSIGEGANGLPLGQFAIGKITGSNEVCLYRDPLGINKLFYYFDSNKKVLSFSNNYFDLLRHLNGDPGIGSLPSGHTAKINVADSEVSVDPFWDLSERTKIQQTEDFSLAEFQQISREKLEKFFESLKEQCPQKKFVICLSGGMDSTIVAQYAKKYLNDVTAVSFSYSEKHRGDCRFYDTIPDGDSMVSEDVRSAARISSLLGIPFRPLFAEFRLGEDELDEVLQWGQDWRDFNVHCSWVNYKIAQAIRHEYGDDESLVILTGDLMNEFVADYTSVQFEGKEYYRLPRISRSRLQKFYVYGLDSSDRELGPFARFKLNAIQPYQCLADHYLSLPEKILDEGITKEILNGVLIQDERVLEVVTLQKKTRAQVGGQQGGSLALFIRAGVTQEQLIKKWKMLLDQYGVQPETKALIEHGRYRASGR